MITSGSSISIANQTCSSIFIMSTAVIASQLPVQLSMYSRFDTRNKTENLDESISHCPCVEVWYLLVYLQDYGGTTYKHLTLRLLIQKKWLFPILFLDEWV